MSRKVFMCIVLVLMFMEFSFGREKEPTKFLNLITDEIVDIRNELDAAGNILEDILDIGITPLIERYSSFYDFIEELLNKIDHPKPLYE